MDSVGIPWNSDILVGIRRILPELMGESKDLDVLIVPHFIILRIDVFRIHLASLFYKWPQLRRYICLDLS